MLMLLLRRLHIQMKSTILRRSCLQLWLKKVYTTILAGLHTICFPSLAICYELISVKLWADQFGALCSANVLDTGKK